MCSQSDRCYYARTLRLTRLIHIRQTFFTFTSTTSLYIWFVHVSVYPIHSQQVVMHEH